MVCDTEGVPGNPVPSGLDEAGFACPLGPRRQKVSWIFHKTSARRVKINPLFDVLHLFAHLLDQHFYVH